MTIHTRSSSIKPVSKPDPHPARPSPGVVVKPTNTNWEVAGGETLPVDTMERKLGRNTWAVYRCLATCRDPRNGLTRIWNETIARYTGIHLDVVKDATAKLKRLGLVESGKVKDEPDLGVLGFRNFHRPARGIWRALNTKVYVRRIRGSAAVGAVGADRVWILPAEAKRRITAPDPRGGPRPGAGRPKGSGNLRYPRPAHGHAGRGIRAWMWDQDPSYVAPVEVLSGVDFVGDQDIKEPPTGDAEKNQNHRRRSDPDLGSPPDLDPDPDSSSKNPARARELDFQIQSPDGTRTGCTDHNPIQTTATPSTSTAGKIPGPPPMTNPTLVTPTQDPAGVAQNRPENTSGGSNPSETLSRVSGAVYDPATSADTVPTMTPEEELALPIGTFLRLAGLPRTPSLNDFLVETPPPARLAPETTPYERARLLVATYLSGLEKRYPDEPMRDFRGNLAKSKHYDNLVAAAAAMIPLNVAPAAWVLYSFDVWERGGGMRTGVVPPPRFVFDPKRLSRQGVAMFNKVELDYRAVPNKITDEFRELTRAYNRAMRLASEAPSLAAARVVVATTLAERGWETLFKAATKATQVARAALAARIASGEMVWG